MILFITFCMVFNLNKVGDWFGCFSDSTNIIFPLGDLPFCWLALLQNSTPILFPICEQQIPDFSPLKVDLGKLKILLQRLFDCLPARTEILDGKFFLRWIIDFFYSLHLRPTNCKMYCSTTRFFVFVFVRPIVRCIAVLQDEVAFTACTVTQSNSFQSTSRKCSHFECKNS